MFHSSLRLEVVVFNIIIIVFFYNLSSAIAQSQEWPSGTLATASTTHAPNDAAVVGEFTPGKAIDKDAMTKWNDDTYERYPDIFTLNIGSVVNLDGITLLSGSDGWILNYTVETTPDGASWNLAATVELSNVVLRFIRFENGPLNVKQLRVIITAAMAGYSRISELSPVYAAASISTTDSLTISTTSTHSSTSTSATTATTAAAAAAITNTPPQASSGTKSNTVGIIAGVLGGLTGILLAVLAFSIWLLRKQRNSLVGTGVKGTGHTGAVAGDATQKSPVSGFSYHSNVASELAGQHPEEAGGYPRTELA